MAKDAYLVLENGKVFAGKSLGAEGEIISEIVFTTGMTGYLNTLTDKSYYGQAVVQTFPLIGNYGVIPEDFESDGIGVNAYIVKHPCAEPSNFRSIGVLDSFLKEQGVVALSGIDTRSLTKMIREQGVMNGMICTSPDHADLEQIRNYRIVDAVKSVSAKEKYQVLPDNPQRRVVLMDFGLKENIKRNLLRRNCELWIVPYDTGVEEILALNPQGIMLSNGPGDPAENTGVIATIRELKKTQIPIFGICLGHQLLALASGFATTKLKYGHRGANQPAKCLTTGNVYITSQNHGYAVVSSSIDPNCAREWFVNVNDGTCEGIEYLDGPAMSVQFHPEACGGPHDTEFLFDRFVMMMEENYAVK